MTTHHPQHDQRAPVRGVLVVVPAHDEEDTVAACLESVDAAAALVQPATVRVVLVADDCRDGTVTVARAVPLRWCRLSVLEVDLRRVGAVRAAGFADASDEDDWLATTDADSRVPPTWLVEQLRSAVAHDVFVGTVLVEDWSARPPWVREAFTERYQPIDGHRHVHATNLGLRRSLYLAVGGFADVAAHEDVALVAACEAAGAAVDWSAAAPVRTSARRSARTPTGFSDYLTRLEREQTA